MCETTIVVPCYNEAKRLNTLAFQRFTLTHGECEFLFVDDCSTDATAEVLTALSLSDSQCRWIHLPRNGGKAAAVREGMLHAANSGCRYLGYWDADLATPLAAIPSFVAKLRENHRLQLVCGARIRLLGRDVRRKPLRHYLGRLFATIASQVLKLSIYDTQCGAKLFRNNEETHYLFTQPFRSDWVFDVELLARMWQFRQMLSLPHPADVIYELPLETWHDIAGSKVQPTDFFRAFGQLIDIYRHYRPDRAAADWHRMVGQAVATRHVRSGDSATQPIDQYQHRTPTPA